MNPHQPTTPTLADDLPGWTETAAAIAVRDTAAVLDLAFVEAPKHRHYALAYDLATAKRHFISQCLLDVQAAACSALRLASHLRSNLAAPGVSEGLHDRMTVSIIAELSMWRRRLTEGLSALLNFEETDSDSRYLHYLLLHDIGTTVHEVRDARGDFGVQSCTFDERLRWLRNELETVGLQPPHWYASAQPGPLRLAPASDVIRAALRRANVAERRALAQSYAYGFSMPSAAMHFSTAVPERQRDTERLQFEIAALVLLFTTIPLRAARLLGMSGPGSPLAQTEAACAAVRIPIPARPQIGDFAIITLDYENAFLSEVLEVRDVDVGTFGVRVRFLGDRPYPEIVEDEFQSDRVTIYRTLVEMMTALLTTAPALQEVSEVERHTACREAMVEVWRVGRDIYLRSLAINAGGARSDGV